MCILRIYWGKYNISRPYIANKLINLDCIEGILPLTCIDLVIEIRIIDFRPLIFILMVAKFTYIQIRYILIFYLYNSLAKLTSSAEIPMNSEFELLLLIIAAILLTNLGQLLCLKAICMHL